MDSADIPYPFILCKSGLENHNILCPADFLCQGQRNRIVGISQIEVAHTANVPCGEALCVRVLRLQILCRRNSRTLFLPAADAAANHEVQLHFRQFGQHCLIQHSKQLAVVGVPSDVHWLLLSGGIRLLFLLCLLLLQADQRKARSRTVLFFTLFVT